jgi:HTH-type transcriptional regulator, pleiotropic regulator of extracellular virulence genes
VVFSLKIGTLIKNKRKVLNISQKELAKNICTQSTISRIEEGKIIPSIELLFKLSIKLQTPAECFIDLLINEQFSDYSLLTEKYNSLLRINDYHSIEKYLQFENYIEISIWKKIYLNYISLLSSYYLQKTDNLYCIEQLLILSNEIVEVNNLYLHIKMQILNSVGNIYGENGEKNKAIFYYNKILSTINYKTNSDIKTLELLLIVRFNKCKTLFDLEKIEEADIVCNESIHICRSTFFVGLMGHFLYYKAQCIEKRHGNNIIEISNLYKECLMIFKFLNQSYFIDHILKYKADYLQAVTSDILQP